MKNYNPFKKNKNAKICQKWPKTAKSVKTPKMYE